eukprot:scaffold710_cov171-Amphora_coffeaeformis.AAC.69
MRVLDEAVEWMIKTPCSLFLYVIKYGVWMTVPRPMPRSDAISVTMIAATHSHTVKRIFPSPVGTNHTTKFQSRIGRLRYPFQKTTRRGPYS